METKEDWFQIKLAIFFIIFLILLFFIANIYKIADYFILKYVDYIKLAEGSNNTKIAQAGQFGDLIGGVLGTVFGIVGTYLLWQTLVKQQLNFQKERFESRFFELIKLYRDSVDEMNIDNVRTGRKCFIPMFKEFKALYHLTFCEYLKYKETNPYFSLKVDDFKKESIEERLCKIAYSYFFSGLGIESKKLYYNQFDENIEFIKTLETAIYTIQIKYREHLKEFKIYGDLPNFKDKFFIYFCDNRYELKNGTMGDVLAIHKMTTENNIKDVFVFEPKYYPFDGHITRLGHYYRNLFQIVRYIVSQEDKLLTKVEVLDYLKLLRTQMSNHEQLMLFYNSLVGAGNKWMEDNKNDGKNYFRQYYMIHNLPLPHVDFGVKIDDIFGNADTRDPHLFEWDNL